MAINAYTGLMGSGKSYEVVSGVIVPAIKKGRRVVTNIAGIQSDAIREYCATVGKIDRDDLGEIVSVTNDDVVRPGFFPNIDQPDAETVVQPGDLVAIDEAWEFWSTGKKISLEHQRFFRMHRHCVHPETGVACDVALMMQSIGDLHRQLRAVVELTFRTKKLKELGAARHYRVEMYETNKIAKSLLLDTFNKTYDKAIFPLYSSYAGSGGKEASIDGRQNILANKRLWVIAVGLMIVAMICARVLWRFFNLNEKTPVAEANALPPPNPAASAAGPAPGNATSTSTSGVSDVWRVAGSYAIENEQWIVVADTAGRLRVESPSQFSGVGITTTGKIDDQRVTPWSGRPVLGRAEP